MNANVVINLPQSMVKLINLPQPAHLLSGVLNQNDSAFKAWQAGHASTFDHIKVCSNQFLHTLEAMHVNYGLNALVAINDVRKQITNLTPGLPFTPLKTEDLSSTDWISDLLNVAGVLSTLCQKSGLRGGDSNLKYQQSPIHQLREKYLEKDAKASFDFLDTQQLQKYQQKNVIGSLLMGVSIAKLEATPILIGSIPSCPPIQLPLFLLSP
jgi:hypothetical protein